MLCFDLQKYIANLIKHPLKYNKDLPPEESDKIVKALLQKEDYAVLDQPNVHEVMQIDAKGLFP